MYGITSQLRRAAVSVATNVAEGASRGHKREYLNFLYMARGSIAEIEYLLHLSERVGYLDNGSYQKLESLGIKTAKTLYGLINSVKKDIQETETPS